MMKLRVYVLILEFGDSARKHRGAAEPLFPEAVEIEGVPMFNVRELLDSQKR